MWASRCLRRGWFLPYTPAEKEFGAWKSHYASCLASLDWLTPREAARTYGTLNQVSAGPTEEAEERRIERRIRVMIREKLQKEKSKLKRFLFCFFNLSYTCCIFFTVKEILWHFIYTLLFLLSFYFTLNF